MEIKSSMTFGKNLLKNLETYCETDPSAHSPVLIYDGADMDNVGEHGVRVVNWKNVPM